MAVPLLTQYGNCTPPTVWRPLACVALLVMPPLGVKAVVQLLRAPKPLNPPRRVPLDALTANSSLLIVLGASALARA